MRSITMCRTTVLAAVAALPALAFAAPASAPEVTATEVSAWIVGDASFESPRFTKALRIDGLDAADVASRFASMPAGRRAAYSERILAGFVGDEGDRVVVSGRITDHVGPWIDAASKRTRLEVEQLAKELVSRGLSIDVLLLGGENPLSAEKFDTADDLVWMAIRNDRRFEEIASSELTLAGAMSPSNPQWRAWNEFADVTIAKAIDASVVAPLREANAAASIAVPVTAGIGRSELGAMPLAIRMHGSFSDADGGATTAFDVLAGELELAVKASRGGRTLQPWVRPYSHAGTRGERSAVAGTLLWDELVRHAILLGNGRVVYEETRSRELAAPDATRFDAVLDGVAEELAGGAAIASTEASIRRGQGFVAVGVPTASGDTLWRISFSPGIGGVDVEIDGDGLRIERRRGESGAWLRTAADSQIEFFERAFARKDATTGGGLLAAPTSKSQEKVGPLLSGGPEGGTTLVGWGAGDLNGDGAIDGADLAIHLASGGDSAWGGVSDLNGDGVVDGADLTISLAGGAVGETWNGTGWEDLNGDGVVDGADLTITLAGGSVGETWNGTGWEDLNGDGVVDGADLTITLAGGGSGSSSGDGLGDGAIDGLDPSLGVSGRVSIRKPDVAGRPKIVDGGVSTVDSDPGSTAEDGGSAAGGTPPSSGGSIPTVDPTTPVTPPAGGSSPGTPRPPLPVPVSMSDSLLETAGTSLFVVPGHTEQIADLGTVPLRIIYGNDDPDRHQGLINVDHVISKIQATWGSNPHGWFMLDYEVPHFTNLARGLDDPNDPLFTATRDSFVNALEQLKARFPETRWTVYGVPSIPSWFHHNGSAITLRTAPAEVIESDILAPRRELYRAIIDASDWVSPAIYVRHDSRDYPDPAAAAQNSLVFQIRATLLTEMGRRLVAESSTPDRPVIPLINLYFAPGGNAQHMREIPIDQVVEKMIRPALLAGADSIAIWTGAGFYARLATVPPNPSHYQPIVRAANVADYLDGQEPAEWYSDELRALLLTRYAAAIRAAVEAIVATRSSIASSP